MSRFKVGQTVYMGRGDKLMELVVARVHKNPLVPVRQYTFEAPNDGFACGEQSLRAHPDDPDLRLRDCFVDDENEADIQINTIASAKRTPIRMEEFGLQHSFAASQLFFRPDMTFVKWLKEYAGERLIIDVGAGQGHLVRMLKMVKARAIGIEKNFNKMQWIQTRTTHDGRMPDVNEMHEGPVELYYNLIRSIGSKGLVIFARPCHSNFVEETIKNMPEGMEALYITIPGNIDKYNDLGDFPYTLLDHEGRSEDGELVYSIIR